MLQRLLVSLHWVFQEVVDPDRHLGVVKNLVHERAALGVQRLHIAVGPSLKHVAVKLIVLILVHGLLLIIDIIIYVSLGLHLQIIKTIATQLIHAVADLPQYSFQRVYISDLSCRVFLDSAAISFLLRWSHDVRASEEGPLLLIGCGKTGLLVSF